MITLTSAWAGPHGMTFPAGTVFIPHRTVRKRTVYVWATPGGARGESLMPVKCTPGQ